MQCMMYMMLCSIRCCAVYFIRFTHNIYITCITSFLSKVYIDINKECNLIMINTNAKHALGNTRWCPMADPQGQVQGKRDSVRSEAGD